MQLAELIVYSCLCVCLCVNNSGQSYDRYTQQHEILHGYPGNYPWTTWIVHNFAPTNSSRYIWHVISFILLTYLLTGDTK